MATGPEHPLIWKLIEWSGYLVGTLASAVAGIMYKRYRNDRKLLLELGRKMREIDGIRVFTDDGRKAFSLIDKIEGELDQVEGEIKQIKRNQVETKRRQEEIMTSIARIETNIEWLCAKHGKFELGS